MSAEMDAKLEAELLSGDGGSGTKRAGDGSVGGPEAKKANLTEEETLLSGDETKITDEFPIPDQLVGLVIGRWRAS